MSHIASTSTNPGPRLVAPVNIPRATPATSYIRRGHYEGPGSTVWGNPLRVFYAEPWPEASQDTTVYRVLEPVFLQRVVSRNKIVEFDKGICLEVARTFENGSYVFFDSRFGIYGFGRTEAEASKDFQDFFVEFYLDIVCSDEKELALSTLEFKRTLIAFATLRERG